MGHLTSSYTPRELDSLTERLRASEIPDEEIAHTIFILGDVHHVDAKSVIERYLDHSDEWVRRNAIMTLTSDFRAQEHRPTCERMIAEETDFDVRNVAISGLGQLLSDVPDIAGLKILSAIVRDANEDVLHREAAYEGFFMSRAFTHGNIRTSRKAKSKPLSIGT